MDVVKHGAVIDTEYNNAWTRHHLEAILSFGNLRRTVEMVSIEENIGHDKGALKHWAEHVVAPTFTFAASLRARQLESKRVTAFFSAYNYEWAQDVAPLKTTGPVSVDIELVGDERLSTPKAEIHESAGGGDSTAGATIYAAFPMREAGYDTLTRPDAVKTTQWSEAGGDCDRFVESVIHTLATVSLSPATRIVIRAPCALHERFKSFALEQVTMWYVSVNYEESWL